MIWWLCLFRNSWCNAPKCDWPKEQIRYQPGDQMTAVVVVMVKYRDLKPNNSTCVCMRSISLNVRRHGFEVFVAFHVWTANFCGFFPYNTENWPIFAIWLVLETLFCCCLWPFFSKFYLFIVLFVGILHLLHIFYILLQLFIQATWPIIILILLHWSSAET